MSAKTINLILYAFLRQNMVYYCKRCGEIIAEKCFLKMYPHWIFCDVIFLHFWASLMQQCTLSFYKRKYTKMLLIKKGKRWTLCVNWDPLSISENTSYFLLLLEKRITKNIENLLHFGAADFFNYSMDLLNIPLDKNENNTV